MSLFHALHHRAGALLRHVLARGAWLAVVGAALGVPASLAVARLLTFILYDVAPTDPLTLVVVAALLASVALLAAYVPARRATRVDPLIALRAE